MAGIDSWNIYHEMNSDLSLSTVQTGERLQYCFFGQQYIIISALKTIINIPDINDGVKS